MQAGHHGLPSAMSQGLSAEASFLQQQLLQGNQSMQPGPGEGQPQSHLSLDGVMTQTSPFLTVPSSSSPAAAAAVSGPLNLGTFSFAELDDPSGSDLYPDVGFSDILMDDGCTMPTGRLSDTLFSQMSPGASSRRSSVTMEDDLWPNWPLNVCFCVFSRVGGHGMFWKRSFTQKSKFMLFQTCMTFFLLWNLKEDILRNEHQSWMVTDILQNIFFCVLQKCHIFGVDYPWKHSTRCAVKCLYISKFWKQ